MSGSTSKGPEKSARDEFVLLGDEPSAKAISSNDGTTDNMASSSPIKLPANLSLTSPMVREWVARRRQNIRPWGDFVRTANFEMPKSLPRATGRIVKNLEHFQSNYVFVFVILIIYCLVTSPMLLFVLAAVGGGCYIAGLRQKERKLMIANHEVTLPQQYALIGVCSVPFFLIAGAGSAVFWVIGASFFFIALHAAFYNFDALDLSEEEEGLTGNIVEEV